MTYRVSVNFGNGRDFEFRLAERDLAGATPDSARRWLERQFLDMGCVPSNPTGKVLLIDKILGVARALGEKPFSQNDKSALEFARNAVVAFEKPALSVNLADLTVG
jgi:hypothetical protein